MTRPSEAVNSGSRMLSYPAVKGGAFIAASGRPARQHPPTFNFADDKGVTVFGGGTYGIKPGVTQRLDESLSRYIS